MYLDDPKWFGDGRRPPTEYIVKQALIREVQVWTSGIPASNWCSYIVLPQPETAGIPRKSGGFL